MNGNHAAKLPPALSATVELRITLDQVTGQIQLSGPVNNSMLMLGMLEMAKVAIIEGRIRQTLGSNIEVVRQAIGPKT